MPLRPEVHEVVIGLTCNSTELSKSLNTAAPVSLIRRRL